MRELLQESWTQISHVCWEGEPWLFKDNEKLGFQADGKRELIKNKQVQVCPFFFFFLKVICILQMMPASFRQGTWGFGAEKSRAGLP